MPIALRQDSRSAVGSIDVEPDPVPATDVADVVKRVDGPRAGGAGAGRNSDGHVSALPVAPDRVIEMRNLHPQRVINGDESNVVAAEAEQFERLAKTRMPLGGQVSHGPTSDVLHPFLANPRQLDVTGHGQPRQVR